VLAGLAAPLGFLDRQVAPAAGASARAELRARWVEVFGPALERLGPNARRGDSDDARLRRAALTAVLGAVAEWRPVLDDAARLARAYLRRRSALDPNLADAVVALAARRGDTRLFRDLLAGMDRAATPQERRRFLMGLGEFSEPALVERALGLTLGGRVATQDVALLLARMLANPAAGERTWTFLTRHWAKLQHRMPPALVTRVIDATPALQTTRHRRAVAAFFRAHPVPTGQRAVRQALERFDRNAELRRRAAPALRAWLAGANPQPAS
jgi:puromycin-sensitive aminopeptidase